MRIVFFGTPHFASEVLLDLLAHKLPIVAVVTQPDRPKGRSNVVSPSEVKRVAEAAGLPILQPEKASEPDFLLNLASYKADLYVVVAFGQILPQTLLNQPPLGCINVHASLLPKYRGAAPMQRALMDGVTETGVSIQKMVRQLDAGDVIAETKITVPLEMNLAELQAALCSASKKLLLSVIHAFEGGIPPAKPQDPEEISFAPKIETEECQLDWSLPAFKIHNKVRALSPKPGAWSWIQLGGEQKRLKILRTQIVSKEGTAKKIEPSHALIYCGEGAIQLLEVQPEGKKVMNASDWLRGLKDSLIFL